MSEDLQDVFQDCRKLAGFTLQTRYLVESKKNYSSSCSIFYINSVLMASFVSHFD